MFIRAQLSAQIATFVDFLISILLNQCANVYYVYATLIGSLLFNIFCVTFYEATEFRYTH
jgi:hypothetical protein